MTEVVLCDRMALRSTIERNAIFSEGNMEKELMLLNAVENSPELSQRELAQRTGLSLGSINILMKKMIREGLIKLEKIPANRVIYMLTAKGVNEKRQKTLYFIKNYYHFILDAKIKIRKAIELRDGFSKVNLVISDETLRDIVFQVVNEMQLSTCDLKKKDINVMIITDDELIENPVGQVLFISELFK